MAVPHRNSCCSHARARHASKKECRMTSLPQSQSTAGQSQSTAGERTSDLTRWAQLVVGIICMVMIANLQYGWTLFTIPIKDTFGWSLASIQVAFTLVVLAGGFLAGLAWILNSYASTLAMLYLAQIIGGIGAGAVYGTAVGNALKWFPDHRGFATGLTAAGFGIGSALTIIPIQHMIATHGFQTTFFTFGLGQGVVVMVLACFLFAPRPGQA